MGNNNEKLAPSSTGHREPVSDDGILIDRKKTAAFKTMADGGAIVSPENNQENSGAKFEVVANEKSAEIEKEEGEGKITKEREKKTDNVDENTKGKNPDTSVADGRRKAQELGRLEKRVESRKIAAIKSLERIFKKEDLKSGDKDDAIRFKNEKLKLDNFKIRFENFITKKTSEAQKKKLEEHKEALDEYIIKANSEIEGKIQERAAEIDEFLAAHPVDEPEEKSAEPISPEAPIVAEIPVSEPVSESVPAPEPNPEPILTSEPAIETIPTPEPALEPEPKMPEEDPENQERRAQERKDRLSQLKAEVEQARKEYAEMDYKKKKAWNRLKSFMPSLFKDQREEDQDVAYCRAVYDNKLFEYKNFLLDEAKEKGSSGKELGELVRLFSVEANLSMADAHTDVKIENHEGKISGKLKDFSLKMIENYRKLPTATKLAIGAGFMGVSVVAGAAGIGVGAAATVISLRRLFMGAVTGTGVALGLEARGRGKTEKLIEKIPENFAEELEDRSEEEKYLITQKIIDKLIYDEDQKINKIKNKNLRNLAAGVGVGTFIGSGVASEIFRGGWHKISDAYHGSGSLQSAGVGLHSEAPVGPAIESHSEAPVGPALESPVNLEVQEGSSLEGTLINHLKSSGVNAEEAGRKAHLMALEYAKENGESNSYGSLIHPGAKIEISPDGEKIVLISDDDNLGYLPEKEVVSETVAEISPEAADVNVPAAEVPVEDIGSSSTEGAGRFFSETTPENEIHHGIEVPENGTGEYVMDSEAITTIDLDQMKLETINVKLDELDNRILKIASGQYEGETIQSSPEALLDELREKKQVYENTKEYLIARIYSGHVGSLRKFIYGGIAENVEKMGGMPATELLDNKSSLGYKFFTRVMDSHSPNMVELQRNITPGKGEKVDEWIIRIGKIMKKYGIKKL